MHEIVGLGAGDGSRRSSIINIIHWISGKRYFLNGSDEGLESMCIRRGEGAWSIMCLGSVCLGSECLWSGCLASGEIRRAGSYFLQRGHHRLVDYDTGFLGDSVEICMRGLSSKRSPDLDHVIGWMFVSRWY